MAGLERRVDRNKWGRKVDIDFNTELEIKDLITFVIAIATVSIGLWQYRRTSTREFIKPLREAQLKLYEKAASLAATLATTPRDEKQWTDAHSEFLCLYYGPLAMLEDFDHRHGTKALTVESAMIAFKDCLDQRRYDRLSDLSLALAHACRSSLGRSWQVRLPQLQGDYQQIAIAYLEQMKREKAAP